MKDKIQYINILLTIIVLIITGVVAYEKENSSKSTDIAVLNQKLAAIETNTIELKQAFNNHVEKCNENELELEKRIIHLEEIKCDNLRTSIAYYNK
jgi:hypothetical protein